jgi:hypothetical protein
VTRKLYLIPPDRKDFEEEKKSCTPRHAKRYCHPSSRVQAFLPQVGGDADLREALQGVDIGKK